MSQLQITLNGDTRQFAPGENMEGTVSWDLPKQSQKFRLSLIWYTQGRAPTASGTVDYLEFNAPTRSGSKDFNFQTPNGPYSFTGKLFSINWALEFAPLPGFKSIERQIILSPSDSAVVIK